MITKLTYAQGAKFPDYVKKWTDIGLCTLPADRPRAEAAIRKLYELSELSPPREIVWVESPIVGAFAAAITARILSENPSRFYSAVDSAVYSAVGSAVRSAVRSISWHSWMGGSLWSAIASWIDFMRSELGVAIPEIGQAYAETVESCGYWWPNKNFCIACERPLAIRRDEQGRLHSPDKKSIIWPDGWGLYHVHGIALPEWVIERPNEISVEKIDTEPNAEVRRVMMDKFTAPRYVAQSGIKPVHSDDFGLLYCKEMPGDEPLAIVKVVNSTAEPDGSFRDYWLRVEPGAYKGAASRIAHAAVASTCRDEAGELAFEDYRDYAPLVET
jgi:hypothetical protein